MTQPISRRHALQTGAAAATAVAVVASTSSFATAGPDEVRSDHPVFQHGVASGDPYSDSVLLWTRVTSHPNDYAGRDQGIDTTVRWEISTDDKFSNILKSGTIKATPATDMTVKPEAAGLSPYTEYYFRFVVQDGPYKGQVSPVGLTRTAPAVGQDVAELRFALVSCANWEAGYFNAYRSMATRRDVDYCLCVGDYIYEYPRGEYQGKTGSVRLHDPANEIISLADYRERYAQYHTDPDLQAAHAAFPWIVTWDDHEVANDSWSQGAENHQPEEGDYNQRRDNAIQAYLEWLPIRATKFSEGGHIYRNLSFGNLAELNMLDLRTYRNEPVSFLQMGKTDDPSRTMLGSEQFQWLAGKLQTSSAKWNLIGNSVMITPVLIPPLDQQTGAAVKQLLGLPQQGIAYNLDQWDGFAAERRRLIALLKDSNIHNTVWLTGDIHSSWACDVPVDPGAYPGQGVAAVEIVTPSITSSNIDDILKLPEDNPLSQTVEFAFTNLNHHIKYLDMDSHGYSVVQFTPDYVHTDWIFVTPDGKLNPQSQAHYARSARAYRGQGVQLHNQPMSSTHAAR